MTRLELIMARGVAHPEDVDRLKREIPVISHLPDGMVQKLYSDWSEDVYAASWYQVWSGSIEAFSYYLRQEVSP